MAENEKVFFIHKFVSSPIYTEFDDDYETFYRRCLKDIRRAKQSTEYNLDSEKHQNNFEVSYISW